MQHCYHSPTSRTRWSRSGYSRLRSVGASGSASAPCQPLPIGDNLARQIEQHCEVEPGWLDKEDRPSEVPDAAEERFIAAAREAWRQANAKGKTELSGWLKQRAARAPGEEPPP